MEKKAFVIILNTNILQASSEGFYVFRLVSQFKVLVYFWINMNLVQKRIYIWITKQRSKYLWTCILSFGKECRGQYKNHWKSTFHQYHRFLHVYWIDLVVPCLAAYYWIENFAMHHVFRGRKVQIDLFNDDPNLAHAHSLHNTYSSCMHGMYSSPLLPDANKMKSIQIVKMNKQVLTLKRVYSHWEEWAVYIKLRI